MKCNIIRKSVDDIVFTGNEYCRVKLMGHNIEVTAMKKRPVGCNAIKRISKDLYEVCATGEIKEYKHSVKKSDNIESLRKTFARIRATISTNVLKPANVRWITLTYSENMTDVERLRKDFDNYWDRFKRFCKRNNIDIPRYISVVEPQGRGAWHIHAYFIWNNKAPFLHNDTVFAPLWKHGITKIKSVPDNVDNSGAYFTSYLTDIETECLESLGVKYDESTVVEKNSKRIVKGGRLHMYPLNMRIMRCSGGIKRPVVKHMRLSDASNIYRLGLSSDIKDGLEWNNDFYVWRKKEEKKEKVPMLARKTFSVAYDIVDTAGNIINNIVKLYYNVLGVKFQYPKKTVIAQRIESNDCKQGGLLCGGACLPSSLSSPCTDIIDFYRLHFYQQKHCEQLSFC